MQIQTEVLIMLANPTPTKRLILKALLLCLMVPALSGCSMMRSSKHIDMGPFAENTINLLADIRAGMDAQTAVYTMDYMKSSATMKYTDAWREYRPMLRGVAEYSLALATISKSNLNEKEKAGKVADVLEKMIRPRIELTQDHAILSEADLNQMLGNIREQTKFLDAVGAAQPLVNAVENFSNVYLDVLKDELDAAKIGVEKQIAADHAPSQDFYKVLIESQDLAFRDLVNMRDYRNGTDPEAMTKMFGRDPQLKILVANPQKPSMGDLQKIEDRLLYRLEKVRDMTTQVQPDLDLYRNKMRELADLYKGANNNLTKTRITVIIWARSHRGMASGVVDPAKIDVMGIAKQALSAALPVNF